MAPAHHRRTRVLSTVLHATVRPNSPLPTPLPQLIYSSMAIATVILVVSLLDIGILSFYLNPCFAFFTLLFDGSVLLVVRRTRRLDSPSFFWTTVICYDMLALLWLTAHVVTIAIMTLPSLRASFNPALVRAQGLPGFLAGQILQVVFTALELLVVVAWAIKGHLLMGKQKETGEDVRWRKFEQETKPTPFTESSFGSESSHRPSGSWDSHISIPVPSRVSLLPVRRV